MSITRKELEDLGLSEPQGHEAEFQKEQRRKLESLVTSVKAKIDEANVKRDAELAALRAVAEAATAMNLRLGLGFIPHEKHTDDPSAEKAYLEGWQDAERALFDSYDRQTLSQALTALKKGAD